MVETSAMNRALGTIVAVLGWQLARVIAPPHLREQLADEDPHEVPEPGRQEV